MDEPIAYTSDGRALFDNALTVVAIKAEFNGSLWAVRRAHAPGIGKLCFPGGYQMRGETWEEGGVREFFEETGMVIEPDMVCLYGVFSTTEKMNLIIGETVLSDFQEPKPCPDEVLSVELVSSYDPDDWAFPIHSKIAEKFFGT